VANNVGNFIINILLCVSKKKKMKKEINIHYIILIRTIKFYYSEVILKITIVS